VFIEELIKQLVSIVDAEMLTLDLIVVMTLTNIREGSIGFVDIVEAALSVNSVRRVFLGMPLSSQPLVSLLNVMLACLFVEAQGFVKVFLVGCVSCSCGLGGAAGVRSRSVNSF
jgi:hypothetical protein